MLLEPRGALNGEFEKELYFVRRIIAHRHERVDQLDQQSPAFPMRADWAALVQRYVLAPAAVPSGDRNTIEKIMESHARDNNSRQVMRTDILRALYLTTEGPIELGSTIHLVEDGQIFRTGYSLQGGMAARFFGRSALLDLKGLKYFWNLLNSFSQRSSINVALDRLGLATNDHDAADKAIDLGLALEIALMASDPAANQEIKNKLCSRVAWLLGSDLGSRRESYRAAGQLYDARSDAAHRGILRPETASRYNFDDSRRIVRDCLAKLLERGRFPDWIDLTLGGAG